MRSPPDRRCAAIMDTSRVQPIKLARVTKVLAGPSQQASCPMDSAQGQGSSAEDAVATVLGKGLFSPGEEPAWLGGCCFINHEAHQVGRMTDAPQRTRRGWEALAKCFATTAGRLPPAGQFMI